MIGAVAVGGRHSIDVIRCRRNNINGRVGGTRVPSVCYISCQQIADVGIQRHMLACTNIGGRSNDLKIRTYIIYSERFRSNDATMFGSSDDHIRASSCIVQHSAGARDGTIPSVVFNTDGSSGQRGRITVAKNIVARDGEHARSFHNNGVGSGKFGLTAGGTDGLDLEIVDARSVERVGELRKRMASTTTSGNFNTIHIPNIGCSICRCGSNCHSRTSANCVVGDSSGCADHFRNLNLNGASFSIFLTELMP